MAAGGCNGCDNLGRGCGLATDALPALDTPLDTLVIAGGQGVRAATEDGVLIDWVRGAIGGGTAHRLRGARERLFWPPPVCWTGGAPRPIGPSALNSRGRFPGVRVEPDPIFVRDGPVWTSAGVTAGIDLALALVEEDLGREFALAVARYMVVFLKRPGRRQSGAAALLANGGGARLPGRLCAV